MTSFSSSKVLLSGYCELKLSSTSLMLTMKKLRTSDQSPPTCPVEAMSFSSSLSSFLSYFSRGLTYRLKEESFPPFSMMLISSLTSLLSYCSRLLNFSLIYIIGFELEFMWGKDEWV